jgi:hypothetical protein
VAEVIGQLLDGIIGGAIDAVRVFFMSREEERRWINADRGQHRPIYAPPIVRHYEPWPGDGAAGQRPYQPWPGSERR